MKVNIFIQSGRAMRSPVSRADRVCDYDCKLVNNCTGHAECSHCGKVFCGCELHEGICEDCREEIKRHTCAECGEYDPQHETDINGLCGFCAAWLEDPTERTINPLTIGVI